MRGGGKIVRRLCRWKEEEHEQVGWEAGSRRMPGHSEQLCPMQGMDDMVDEDQWKGWMGKKMDG